MAHGQAVAAELDGPADRVARRDELRVGLADEFDQEPGDADEIKSFCSLSYDVSFPMFGKIEVNGDNAHPFYQWLKKEKSGLLGIGAIKWNFTKFLIGRDGAVLKRYAPTDKPETIEKDIVDALKA